jgi:hypothetical protein
MGLQTHTTRVGKIRNAKVMSDGKFPGKKKLRKMRQIGKLLKQIL